MTDETLPIDGEQAAEPIAENQPEQTEGQQSEQQPQPPAEPKPDPVQKRIDRVVSEREAARQHAAELEARLQELEARYAPKANAEPYIGDFDSIEAYQQAYQDYTRQQVEQQWQQQQQTQQQQRQQAEVQQRMQQAVQRAQEVYPDYDAVITRGDALVGDLPEPVMAVLRSSPDAGLIAYELAKDPAKAVEFAEKPVMTQLLEIARIADRLSVNPPTRTPQVAGSKAPQPISPVTANSPASRDPDKMSTDEWMKWRRGQAK